MRGWANLSKREQDIVGMLVYGDRVPSIAASLVYQYQHRPKPFIVDILQAWRVISAGTYPATPIASKVGRGWLTKW